MRGTTRGSPRDASKKLTAKERRERIRDAERLIRKFDLLTVAGLRNRAIVALVEYGMMSLNVVLRLRIGDYSIIGNRGWVRLVVSGKEHQVLLHSAVGTYIDEYLEAAGIKYSSPKSWLFRVMRPGSDDRIDILPLTRDHFQKILQRADQPSIEDFRLSPTEVQQLIESIQPYNIEGARDRAIIGIMLYLSATPVQIESMRVRDYNFRKGRNWIWTTPGRAATEAPAVVATLLEDYLLQLGAPNSYAPLFPSRRHPNTSPMTAPEILEILHRRISEAGLLSAHRLHSGLATDTRSRRKSLQSHSQS